MWLQHQRYLLFLFVSFKLPLRAKYLETRGESASGMIKENSNKICFFYKKWVDNWYLSNMMTVCAFLPQHSADDWNDMVVVKLIICPQYQQILFLFKPTIYIFFSLQYCRLWLCFSNSISRPSYSLSLVWLTENN